jgi:hypothetical protein
MEARSCGRGHCDVIGRISLGVISAENLLEAFLGRQGSVGNVLGSRLGW